MEFVCFTDWKQLPEGAEALFSQAAEESVFFSRPWFENLLDNAPDDRRNILLACVLDDDRVMAILPLERRSSETWYALTNLYSSLYTLLLAQENQQLVLECLASGLSRQPFSLLRLDPVADDDLRLQAFQQALEAKGICCHRTFRFHNWIHRTRGQTFQAYMQARPARVRSTIARKKRKLQREHGYVIRLYTDRGLQRAMADYNTVYKHSWKANELYGPFVEGLAQRLSEHAWLRLAILYIDDMPVAAQFWFVVHGKASIFKLVYDEKWKHYSPGSILTEYLMEQVIDTDKVSEIDFLTGNDAYKQDWMSERRGRSAFNFIHKPVPRHGSNRLLNWVRGFIQQHP